MLLDPYATGPVGSDSLASGRRSRKPPRKAPLSREEGKKADARTCMVLAAHGVTYQPSKETVLLALSSSAKRIVADTLERPIFASEARSRAAAMAMSFDAFAQASDLRNLRLIGLRPGQGKAKPGGLAEALAALSKDYNRRVSRLVGAGTIRPVLSVVHIRFDVSLDMWDVHIHALWDVANDKIDAMWTQLGTTFADKWIGAGTVQRPGAAANYAASWTIDHRQIMDWPDHALLEVWGLRKPQLMRPAGAFLLFRRSLKDKLLRRDGDRVVVEDRPVKTPRRPAARRPGPAAEGARVVAITMARFGKEKELCAVLKRPRAAPASAQATHPNPATARAHLLCLRRVPG